MLHSFGRWTDLINLCSGISNSGLSLSSSSACPQSWNVSLPGHPHSSGHTAGPSHCQALSKASPPCRNRCYSSNFRALLLEGNLCSNFRYLLVCCSQSCFYFHWLSTNAEHKRLWIWRQPRAEHQPIKTIDFHTSLQSIAVFLPTPNCYTGIHDFSAPQGLIACEPFLPRGAYLFPQLA